MRRAPPTPAGGGSTVVTREYPNLRTICRPHFKSNKVRIEIDSDTISDWNYIDYVQVR